MTATGLATAPAAGSTRSLPDLLLEHAAARPHGVAMRQKELGIWRQVTWSEYAQRAADLGLGLLEAGVVAGDRVAIHSSNRHEWVLADIAIQGIGAATVGIYPTNPPAAVEHLLRHSETTLLIAENEEQLDKALEVRHRLPNLRTISVIDTRGIRDLSDPMLVSFEELEALGRQRAREEWRDRVSRIEPDATATIVYTAGTTGLPKGAMLTHANLRTAGQSAAQALGAGPDDEVISYLPLSDVAERLVSVVAALAAGYVVNFGEGGDSFAMDIQEVQPTMFLGVPRFWDKLTTGVETRIAGTTRLKRACYRFAVARGRRVATRRRKGKRGGAAAFLAWLVAGRSLRAKLGFGRTRVALSGAAPIAPRILEELWSFGVPVREGYGLTEGTGVATLDPASDVRIGSVGVALPGVEVRLREDGEVLLRGDTVFAGYFRDEDATRAAKEPDGWLHTGDVGELGEDGHLTITGRKKDLIITAGGKNVSPAAIESLIKASPLIREAVVVGDGRKYLTALLAIEPGTVSAWAGRRRLEFTSFEDLAAHPEVHELVAQVIADVNGHLAEAEQIKRFELLPEELDEDAGQVTATEKVRRAAIAEQFGSLIEGMYPDEDGETGP